MMTGEDDIIYLDEKLNPGTTSTTQLKDLMKKVIPNWQSEEIIFKPLSAGMVNSIWLCSNPISCSKKLIIRIHPDKERLAECNRRQEFEIMRKLSERKFIPPVRAKFFNGIVYEYAEGDIIQNFELMHDPHIKQLILQKLHVMHSIPLSDLSLQQHTYKDSHYYRHITRVVEDMADSYQDPELQNIYDCELQDEIPVAARQCSEMMEELVARHPLVFCHHDLWWSNLVFDREKDEMHFIDWEMGEVGVVPLELGIMIQDWTGSYITDDVKEEQFQRSWIRTYLELKPGSSGEVEDNVIDQWYIDVQKGSAIACVAMVVWALWVITVTEDPQVIKDTFILGYKSFKRYYKIMKNIELLEKPKDHCNNITKDCVL